MDWVEFVSSWNIGGLMSLVEFIFMSFIGIVLLTVAIDFIGAKVISLIV